MRTVLVCGGRDYNDEARLNAVLSTAHLRDPIGLVLHGAANGADTLAGMWARARGIRVMAFPANWEEFGKRAGFLRNERMLVEGKPDVVAAFPGGRGTADMVRRAKAAGVRVVEIS
jgi:rhamnogalacturonyl hydrolase YesR